MCIRDREITCTKVQLTDEGAFDELDVALMLHPYQKTCGRMGSIGIYPVQDVYKRQEQKMW